MAELPTSKEGLPPVDLDGTASQQQGSLPTLRDASPPEFTKGSIAQDSIPATMEYISAERLRGTDAMWRALAGWAKYQDRKFEELSAERMQLNDSLRQTTSTLLDERERRVLAEERLRNEDAYRPLRELAQASGIGLIGLGIVIWEQGLLGLAIGGIGGLLWAVAYFLRRAS